jgi:hypothetical protein
MNSIGGLRKERGEFLAGWLNGPGQYSRVGLYISLCVDLASSESARRLGRRVAVQEAFAAWVGRVNEDRASKGEPLLSPELETRVSRLGLDFDLAFGVETGKDGFSLVSVNEDSKALLQFANLTDLGGARNVRRCRACDKYFYACRADARVCSPLCKVALWRKTPAGREKRAAYMRDYRAKVRRLWEAKQQGRRLRRGRNLHVSLKRGE